MEVIQPGIEYKLFKYSDKDDYITVRFVEKQFLRTSNLSEDDVYIGMGGIVNLEDGITNEEIWYMMLDRFKHLNDKSYSKSNDVILDSIRTIIGETKKRKKKKQENKKRYEEKFQSE